MAKKKNLKKDIEKSIKSWNERSAFKLGGVGNLSRSDLSTLELYAEYIEAYGNSYRQFLMKPLGRIAAVLEVYGYEI